MLPTILNSIDTFGIIATTSSSITLAVLEIGSIAKPISAARACGLTISNEVIHEIVMQKYNKYKKQYEKIKKLLNLLITYIEKVY